MSHTLPIPTLTGGEDLVQELPGDQLKISQMRQSEALPTQSFHPSLLSQVSDLSTLTVPAYSSFFLLYSSWAFQPIKFLAHQSPVGIFYSEKTTDILCVYFKCD